MNKKDQQQTSTPSLAEQERAALLEIAQRVKAHFINILFEEADAQRCDLRVTDKECAARLEDALFVTQVTNNMAFNQTSPRENIVMSGIRHAYQVLKEPAEKERLSIKYDALKALEAFAEQAAEDVVVRAEAAYELMQQHMNVLFIRLKLSVPNVESFKEAVLKRFMRSMYAAAYAEGALEQQEQSIIKSFELQSSQAAEPFKGLSEAEEIIHNAFRLYASLEDLYQREFEKRYGIIEK